MKKEGVKVYLGKQKQKKKLNQTLSQSEIRTKTQKKRRNAKCATGKKEKDERNGKKKKNWPKKEKYNYLKKKNLEKNKFHVKEKKIPNNLNNNRRQNIPDSRESLLLDHSPIETRPVSEQLN